jgi:hypothetical protein
VVQEASAVAAAVDSVLRVVVGASVGERATYMVMAVAVLVSVVDYL